MSLRSQKKMVEQSVDVIGCDGPDCIHHSDFERWKTETPKGWIALTVGVGKSTAPHVGHFCSFHCLALWSQGMHERVGKVKVEEEVKPKPSSYTVQPYDDQQW